MQIGEPKRIYRVEPIQAPVPTERPQPRGAPETSPRRPNTQPEPKRAALR